MNKVAADVCFKEAQLTTEPMTYEVLIKTEMNLERETKAEILPEQTNRTEMGVEL